MRWLVAFFRKPWVLPLIAIVLFSLIIWFVGPLVAIAGKVPLASETWRLLVIMAALLLWGLNNLRVKKQEVSASTALTEGLQADAKKAPAEVDAVNPDEEMLNKRLQDSLALLKGSRFEREGKLYKLPWYIIIGAPGSGKTTAIQNSGLQFPLQDKIGNEPVKGEGGTRYCDWWFTDEAILIDTAGRYTTQDNPQKIESGAWLGFLSRIKKARPKRPLNGILVTISVQDILTKTATQKSLQITAIKQRIQELNNHLQMKLPVYVIFSKMDMVAGFGSFFGDMEKQDREQLWGFSARSRNVNGEGISQWFDSEYNQLIENLYQRVNHRLNRETSQQKRSLISEFPRQMQALQSQLEEFISTIFSTNQFEAPLFLRGVFFLSSTQTASVSQWITSLAPAELMAPPADHTGGEAKTFFVQSLFKDFIFTEANVASVNERVTQRFRAAYTTLLVLGFGGFASALYAWSNSKSLNEQYLTDMNQAIESYHDTTDGGLTQPHSWQVLNEGLNLLRDLPTGFSQGDDLYTIEQGFGLYQGDKLGAQARTTYVDGLSVFFMEDFSQLLLEQVKNSFDDDERLYEALKFYLMLYYPEHLDGESLQAWGEVLWARKLPGSQQEGVRQQLEQHLKTALEQQVLPAPMDESAVAAARETLIKTPLDIRAYRRIKNDYLDGHKQQFSVQGVLGKKAGLLFERRSGLSLSEGIPAFFTFDGFHTGFNVANVKLAQKITDEQWIYGDTLGKQITEQDLAAIKQSVNDLYMQEYQTRWDYFLNDLALQPFGTINRGKTVVRQLAGADEPLVTLLKAIRKNTALAEVPGLDKDTTKALGRVADNVASNQKSRLERLVPTELIAKKTKLPGQEINNYYAELNSYVADGGSTPLLNLQEAIHGLNYYLQKLVYAEDIGQAAFASTSGDGQKQALMQLQIAIDEAPRQLRPWFNGLGKNTAKVAIVATKTHLNTSWKGDVLGFYEQHLKGKYPLDKTSDQDIKLSDFVAFFGPGGVLDSYFDQYLSPYVDTSGRLWRWKKSAGMSNQALAFFQRAQNIKQAFFSGGEDLNVAFTLKPHTLDKTASSISMDINGENLNYHHGPPSVKSFQWPGPDPTENKLMFNLVSRGTPLSVRTDGEWSWFRMLDAHAITTPNRAGGLLVTFALNGIASTQELRPAGNQHPFNPELLEGFAPPGRL